MNDAILVTFLVGLIAATLRVATPLVFGTVGEVITERAGVLNLGIEGTMFLGAFVGFAAAYKAEAAGIGGYLWIAAYLLGLKPCSLQRANLDQVSLRFRFGLLLY